MHPYPAVATAGGGVDGGQPALPHLRPPPATSTLIVKGTNVGLPGSGAAPDLGAFEQTGGTQPSGQRYEAENAPAADLQRPQQPDEVVESAGVTRVSGRGAGTFHPWTRAGHDQPSPADDHRRAAS